MDIIKSNIDVNNKYDLYKLTKSSGAMIQDAPDGLSIPVSKWALYNDPKAGKDGQEKDNFVLSFIDNSGVKYSTVSPTFQREFGDIVEIMGADPFAIIVMHGQTKAGKPFVTCELDCEFPAGKPFVTCEPDCEFPG